MSAMSQHLNTALDEIREAGTWKTERLITTPQFTTIGVSTQDEKVAWFPLSENSC